MTYICAPIFVTIPRDNGISVDFQPTGGVEVAIPSGPKGLDGVSPTIEVTDILGGHKVTITDVNGTEEFNVMDGGISESDFLKVFPTDTASGAVATFPDGADQVPLKTLTVAIEPVQDLNGYDNPWPAGGGKNKYDKTATDTSNGYIENKYINGNTGTLVTDSDCNVSEYIPVTGNLEYTVSGVSGSNVGIGFYDSTKSYLSAVRYAITWGTVGNKTFTTPANCAYVRLSVVKNNINITQLESGSSATPYAPYSNICPISGWTEAKVTRTGVNVWDEEWELGTFLWQTDGYYLTSGTYVASSHFIAIKPLTSYYYKSTANAKVEYYDAQKKWLREENYAANSVFTTPANAAYMMFRTFAAYGTTYNNDISINYPSTDHDYHAYSGNTYTIDLSGTRYGGTLDVLTGVLTVTKANIASYNGETLPGEWISSMDVYAPGTTPTTGAQVVYELASSQTVQLTAQQVSSLLGANNVWADTGNVSVVYRADIGLFIDKKLNA